MWLIFFGGIGWLKDKISGSNTTTQSPPSSRTQNRSRPRQNPETYRPQRRSASRSTIKFGESQSFSSSQKQPDKSDLDGLHDAFTGAPLDSKLGLHQCQSCKVYYHTESLGVLREMNSSQCVSCQSTNILVIVPGSGEKPRGNDYNPNVVTLQNYKEHVGRVVTFEGYVSKVNESRRGNDFAVMFENKSWTQGFKLVFFKGAVRKVGGKPYITSLQGQRIKVRGLIINHDTFGYEIIVSEKSMILEVSA